ncbi:2Fe-2S iron-sulfur cluster-binding protein [Umezawaea sp. Da 62-37]|uniref:(2Fe-2S)-binding protein n=1 Tax=Umezawaea sp. Da 62-37 TaxID=3075927 RepID=UPI0028F6C7A6|nr:2Fe-2S iron-sulfur cluster-binding protein [Umezawaea sp. Da 62-37]WNV87930.1 2Fe-2S iron-sulfur cluster-binding protein [Umezawaea sp. Da 62-37]
MAVRRIKLNGKEVRADYQSVVSGTAESSEQLLHWLREQHGQIGPKFGCGISQCGACTVLVDGAITRSCVTQVHTVVERAEVRTLDGLSKKNDHPLQKAFVELQAGQCGFCLNGMVMGVLGWLEERMRNRNRTVPTQAEIKDFLSGGADRSKPNYLCRCGTHYRIVAAVEKAAKEMLR